MKKIILCAFFANLLVPQSVIGADEGTPIEKILRENVGPPWAPISAIAGPLRARVIVGRLLGRNLLDVVLSNTSDEFFCIDSRTFDARYSHISFKGAAGRYVPQLSASEPVAPTIRLGFDYDASYKFIYPGEVRKVGIDIGNFNFKSGSYTYDIIFDYYRCRDIIDPARIRRKKDIDTFSVHANGTVMLQPELGRRR
jgi:hypothetical protein